MSSRSRRRASVEDPDAPEDVDERDVRAATERLFVHDLDGDVVVVYSGARPHLVDERSGTCSCDDAYYRRTKCKHVRRLEMERGERDLPPVQCRRIDPLLLDA